MFLIKIYGATIPEAGANGISTFEEARHQVHQAMVKAAGGALWSASREISVKFLDEKSTKESLVVAEIDCLYTDVLARADEFTTSLLETLCRLFGQSDVFVFFTHDGRKLSEARAATAT